MATKNSFDATNEVPPTIEDDVVDLSEPVISLEGVSSKVDYPVIAKGIYRGSVTSMDYGVTINKNPRIKIKVVVALPTESNPDATHTIVDTITLSTSFGKALLQQLRMAANPEAPDKFTPSQFSELFCNRPMDISVDIRKGDTQYPDRNSIKSFMKVGSGTVKAESFF